MNYNISTLTIDEKLSWLKNFEKVLKVSEQRQSSCSEATTGKKDTAAPAKSTGGKLWKGINIYIR